MADVDTESSSANSDTNTVGGISTTTTITTTRYLRTTVDLYPGIYQSVYDGGGSDVGTFSDANGFIAKFAQNGTIQWSTLLGGPNYTRCYAIRVDASGNVYVGGRSGMDLDTTVGVMQTGFAGSSLAEQPAYGPQNGFVGKFNSRGVLQWLTYVGTGDLVRDLDIAPDGSYVVVPLVYDGTGSHAGNHANCSGWNSILSSGYQSTPTAYINGGCIKIDKDGQAVAATYLGGNARGSMECMVKIDPSDGSIYLLQFVQATDLTVSSGCLSYSAGNDLYVCKFDSSLSNLLWGTYLGGTGNDLPNTHNLALDGDGNLFVSAYTTSTDIPTTTGAYMESYPTGATNTCSFYKLDADNGNLLACTYFGGTGGDNPDGLMVDDSGNVWSAIATTSTDMPYTANAYQSSHNGGVADGGVIALSNDLDSLVYGSFIGGDAGDNLRDIAINTDASLVLAVGSCDGGTYPMQNAYQSNYGGVQGGDPGYGFYAGDAVITLIDMSDNPTTLEFSTFLGGSHWDMGRGAYIDSQGYCYISGGTHSDDFPTYDY